MALLRRISQHAGLYDLFVSFSPARPAAIEPVDLVSNGHVDLPVLPPQPPLISFFEMIQI